MIAFGISNVLVTSVLAVSVFMITRICRNHYLAHGLWVLVLVKLLTPPIYEIPITLVSSSDAQVMAPILINSEIEIPRPSSSWLPSLVYWWLISSLIVLAIAVVRSLRFHRALKAAACAPVEVQRYAGQIAGQLGTSREPTVRIAPIGPLAWPFGAIVVVPQQLISDLSPRQLETVIAHELVHFSRRDHWIRFLEAGVMVVYWWNPVVWWIFHELRAAEEACCDAEVIRLFPDSVADYGDALLRACELRSAPMLASGMGSLKRRLEMILENGHQRRSATVKVAVAAFAVVTLPWNAVIAQDQLPSGVGGPSDNAEVRQTSPERSLEQRVAELEQRLANFAAANVPTELGATPATVDTGPRPWNLTELAKAASAASEDESPWRIAKTDFDRFEKERAKVIAEHTLRRLEESQDSAARQLADALRDRISTVREGDEQSIEWMIVESMNPQDRQSALRHLLAFRRHQQLVVMREIARIQNRLERERGR